MNSDMQLIIDEVRRTMSGGPKSNAPPSPMDMLLQQAAVKSTKH